MLAPRAAVDVAALSGYSGIQAEVLERWQTARRLTLHHDESGQLAHACVIANGTADVPAFARGA